MKTKLKPEQEQIVTPGKKAVDDLVQLPNPAKVNFPFELPGIVVCDGSKIIEKADLLVAAEPIEHPDGVGPPLFTLREALSSAERLQGYVPSSALSFSILHALWERGYRSVLDTMLDADYQLMWQNTLVDFDPPSILHYPVPKHPNFACNEDRASHRTLLEHVFYREQYTMDDVTIDHAARLLVTKLLGVPNLNDVRSVLDHAGLDFRLKMPSKIDQAGDYAHVRMGVIDSCFEIHVQDNLYHQEYVRMVKSI